MPDTMTSGATGLITAARTPVPLMGVTVDAELTALCARVTVSQHYVNRETSPIEAVYLFPLEEGAAVCAFEAVVDGTLVVGEVKEREEAFRIYDDAMERGDGGFLLDEERPDVFRASIGNLPAGKEVLVRLTYVAELEVQGSALRFTVPTTIAPRYAPAEDRRGVGQPDVNTLNPQRAWSVPYGLTVTVRVRMDGGVAKIESPSHPISMAMDASGAIVSLSQRDAALDRDFVLAIDGPALDQPQAWIERGDDARDVVALGFVPAFDGAIARADVTFLVDRSGSMQGTSIAEVRNALQLCLRSLTPGCRFEIIGFGSTIDALFGGSQEYTDATLQRASEHVAQMEADLGGTEILPALAAVLDRPASGELPRQILVLTDGEVTNTDAVLALVRTHCQSARVFAFGIGAGASHHLVKGLARAGGGAAEFIHPGERIEPKVLRQFKRILSPALHEVRITWQGLRVKQAPSAVPPVFTGSRLMVYGFVDGTIGAGAVARLEARGPSGPVAFEVPIAPHRGRNGSTLGALAARARIRELEEGGSWVPARGSRQMDRQANAVVREIVELATRYGLMSRETSYVAIERREAPVQSEIQLRRIPIALTAGWGGLHERADMVPPLAAMSDPLPIARAAAHRTVRAQSELSMLASRPGSAPSSSIRDRFVARMPTLSRRTKHGAPAVDQGLQRLIRLQAANGTWDLTRELADLIGTPLDVLEREIEVPGGSREHRLAWATALAVAWLRRHAAEAREEWEMLAGKAEQWLTTSAPARGDGRPWIERAEQALGQA
jgi:Ca-activated chloride channel homolog